MENKAIKKTVGGQGLWKIRTLEHFRANKKLLNATKMMIVWRTEGRRNQSTEFNSEFKAFNQQLMIMCVFEKQTSEQHVQAIERS